MKKLIITLLAAVLASGAFAQSSFPDIPANHWAGDAVERIADLGIVIGFPDGTYRGNEAFTRYQAALVVSRLLDVLNDNVNAALALTQADVDSLRNAVQELASDVAAQGVRLSAAESAIAGLSDDAATTNARLDNLEALLGTGDVDPAVLRDLQNQIASQRVALDTAQATADAAAARADDAYGLARRADTRSRENASDIDNLNRVIGLMQRDINALKSASGGTTVVEGETVDLSGVNSAIERNRSDIANIREFVILLRRDQVALRDRVSALEASDAAQDEAIADLQSRVTELEENPLGINGTIALRYYVGRTTGPLFDVDRAYGLNNERDMGASIFSAIAGLRGATLEYRDDPHSSSRYRGEFGEVRQDVHDIVPSSGDNFRALLSLNFGYAFGFDGEGSPRGLNRFDGVIDVSVDSNYIPHTSMSPGNRDSNLPGGAAVADWLRVERFETTFSPIGMAPLEFTFGTNVQTQFTPYVLATNDPGFVATITAPDFLAFLDPTLTAVYTTPGYLTGIDPVTGNPVNESNDYQRGLRLTIAPLDGLTVGGSFAQYAINAGDHEDIAADNVQTTVYGADANLSISVFNLGFEWAQGSISDNSRAPESILYAELDVDAGQILPIIESIGANYRDISDSWNIWLPSSIERPGGADRGDGYNLGANPSGFPYSQNQAGFGVDASLNLFNFATIGVFFDTFSNTDGDSSTAFGANVGADLFAGFALSGWYQQASVNGIQVDSQRRMYDADENAVTFAGPGDMRRNGNNFQSGFGVELAHDGDAENALISGLNLTLGYEMTEADLSRNRFYADADYTLNVSIVTLTPYVSFSMDNDSDTVQTFGTEEKGLTEIGAGLGLSTTPLDIFLAPSLLGAVNYRTATHTPYTGAEWTASELQWSVGLVLNEFVFDNSSLTVKYGSWTGENMANWTNTRRQANGGYADDGAGDGATDISLGDMEGTGVQTTSGYEVIWNYWDLQFAYGVYTNDNAGVSSAAQAFQITYTVSF